MKKIIFLGTSLMLMALLILSCSSDNDDPTICYSFDQKQCAVDPWAAFNSDDDLEIRVQAYLKSQGIISIEFRVDETFHEVTCQACEVCPDAPRFYIELAEKDKTKIEALGLLNLSAGACSNIF